MGHKCVFTRYNSVLSLHLDAVQYWQRAYSRVLHAWKPWWVENVGRKKTNFLTSWPTSVFLHQGATCSLISSIFPEAFFTKHRVNRQQQRDVNTSSCQLWNKSSFMNTIWRFDVSYSRAGYINRFHMTQTCRGRAKKGLIYINRTTPPACHVLHRMSRVAEDCQNLEP